MGIPGSECLRLVDWMGWCVDSAASVNHEVLRAGCYGLDEEDENDRLVPTGGTFLLSSVLCGCESGHGKGMRGLDCLTSLLLWLWELTE